MSGSVVRADLSATIVRAIAPGTARVMASESRAFVKALGAGPPGASAYMVAVRDGYFGTEADWLASLKGAPGENTEADQVAYDDSETQLDATNVQTAIRAINMTKADAAATIAFLALKLDATLEALVAIGGASAVHLPLNIDKYGARTNYAAALAMGLAIAAASGQTLTDTPGYPYVCNVTTAVTDINIRADLRATVTRSLTMGNVPILSVNYTFVGGVFAAATAVAQKDFGQGTVADCAFVTTALPVAVGDYVKLLSDDLIPRSQTAGGDGEDTNERCADDVTVGALGVGGFWTLNPLREQSLLGSVNNLRAVKYRKMVCELNMHPTDAPGYPNNRTSPLIDVIGAVKAKIRGSAVDTASMGFRIISCPRVNIEILCCNMRTSDTYNAYGYGVFYASCCDGYIKVWVERSRHGGTSGTYSTAANDARIERYGACIHMTLWGDGKDCLNSPIDTHSDALYTVFEFLRSRGEWRGETSSAPGCIRLRGYGSHYNYVDVTAPQGIEMSIADSPGDVDSLQSYFKIDTMIYRRPKGTTVNLVPINFDASAVTTAGYKVYVEIGTLDITIEDGILSVIMPKRANVRIRNLITKIVHSGASTQVIYPQNGSTVLVDSWRADFTAAPGAVGSPRLVRVTASSETFTCDSLHLTTGTSGYVFCDAGGTNPTILFHCVYADRAPTSGWANMGATAKYWATMFVDFGTSASPNQLTVALAAGDNTIDWLAGVGNPEMQLSVSTAFDNSVVKTLGKTPVRRGQTLRLTNTGAKSFMVANNLAGRLSMPTDRLLAPNTTMILSGSIDFSTWAAPVGGQPMVSLRAVTNNTTFVVPAGYGITAVLINETTGHAVSGGGGGGAVPGIKIGTTAGGADVIAPLVVGANSLQSLNDAVILKRIFSLTADTTLYLQAAEATAPTATAWNGASLTVLIHLQRIN